MIRSILALCFLFATSAYSQPLEGNKKMTWNEIVKSDFRIELVDPEAIKIFRFGVNGRVLATVGTKKALMGPTLQWKIETNTLKIFDQKNVFDQLTLLKKDGATLQVRNASGNVVEYKYSSQ